MLQHVDSLQLHKHEEENMKKEQHSKTFFTSQNGLSKTNRSVKPPNPMRPPTAANEVVALQAKYYK